MKEDKYPGKYKQQYWPFLIFHFSVSESITPDKKEGNKVKAQK